MGSHPLINDGLLFIKKINEYAFKSFKNNKNTQSKYKIILIQKYNDNNITKFCQFVQYPCTRTCPKSSLKLENLQGPAVVCDLRALRHLYLDLHPSLPFIELVLLIDISLSLAVLSNTVHLCTTPIADDAENERVLVKN